MPFVWETLFTIQRTRTVGSRIILSKPILPIYSQDWSFFSSPFVWSVFGVSTKETRKPIEFILQVNVKQKQTKIQFAI